MTTIEQERRIARRRWHGSNLNYIPVEIAYDFELGYIIDNDLANGFRGSRARVAAARRELAERQAFQAKEDTSK